MGTLVAMLGLALGAHAALAQGIQVHGLLDIVASGRGPGYDLNTLEHRDSPYDPFGLRVFGEGSVNPRFAIFTQGVMHDASSFYMEGAYVVFTPQPGRDLHAMAGKIPWPIGTFPPRSYSDKNPLIGKPLMYSYPTTLLWYSIPPNADAMLAAAGSGLSGGMYSGSFGRGMPVLDDSYWDTGAAITGSMRPLEFAAGVTNGTPGWANVAEDENHSKTTMGRIGVVPVPGFRAGISGAYGAYLVEDLDSVLPAGRTANDYHQKLGMADAEVMLGHGELRAEGYSNAWETPNLGDLRVNGGYVEGRWTLFPGWWAAARGEIMRFGSLRDSTGLDRPWDHDRDRIEAGLGYRPDPAVRLKATWQRNVEHMGVPGAKDRIVDFLGMLMTVGF
jgi:hypothetical protein